MVPLLTRRMSCRDWQDVGEMQKALAAKYPGCTVAGGCVSGGRRRAQVRCAPLLDSIRCAGARGPAGTVLLCCHAGGCT